MSSSIWLRRWWRWAVPLALVVLNLGVLSFYRLIYSGRVAQVQSRIEEAQADLEEIREQRLRVEELVERAAASRVGVDRLYRESFATEGERLTSLIRKVKELATTSGLVPDAISYPADEIDEHHLIKRSIVFTVGGSYSDLRRFVNLLELSDEFVVLESLRLNAADPELRIGLRLSTLFSSPDRTDPEDRVTKEDA